MGTQNDKLFAMQGKTIASVEIIPAEWGRTYDQYICIVFTDGTKLIIHGGVPYEPDPSEEDMKKAPHYFTPDDVAAKVRRDLHRKNEYVVAREREERKTLKELQEKYKDKPEVKRA